MTMPQQHKCENVRRKLMRLFLIIFIFTSCNLDKGNKGLLKETDIALAQIKRVDDSVSKQVNSDQIQDFVKKWNHSGSKGIIKFLAEYNVILHLKNGDFITFRTYNDLIKQFGDATYKINDKDFFSNLYQKAR
jgi:hypothetical protein